MHRVGERRCGDEYFLGHSTPGNKKTPVAHEKEEQGATFVQKAQQHNKMRHSKGTTIPCYYVPPYNR